jgi:hypothetical protein
MLFPSEPNFRPLRCISPPYYARSIWPAGRQCQGNLETQKSHKIGAQREWRDKKSHRYEKGALILTSNRGFS